MVRLEFGTRLACIPFLLSSTAAGGTQLSPFSVSIYVHFKYCGCTKLINNPNPVYKNSNRNLNKSYLFNELCCTNFQTVPSPTSETQSNYLQILLESDRPFLRGQLENADVKLPSLISDLKSVGASECWHKHSSFLDHLVDTYRILKLWGAPDEICLCGLFHSGYSNSYLNLAIFDPLTSQDTVRGHVGEVAERLIHLFCIVPHQQLIHDDLLFQYTDESELLQHLKDSEKSLINAKNGALEVGEEEWRKKLHSVLPAHGIVLKHIRTGEDVRLSRRVVATFLLITIADFSDQFFGFQDVLFDNSDGMLKFSSNDVACALWPGDGKPGLWMSSISRMGAIYTLIVREQLYSIEQGESGIIDSRDDKIELVITPILENYTKVLSAKDQIEARDLYWEGVCEVPKRGLDGCEEVLKRSVEKNPFVGEPHSGCGADLFESREV